MLGAPPFHATELTTAGELAYVGGNWTRDIAFAGTSIPLTVSLFARVYLIGWMAQIGS